jgi:hypothetical protein
MIPSEWMNLVVTASRVAYPGHDHFKGVFSVSTPPKVDTESCSKEHEQCHKLCWRELSMCVNFFTVFKPSSLSTPLT